MKNKPTSPVCPTMLRLLLYYDIDTGFFKWKERKPWMFNSYAQGRGRKSKHAIAATWNAQFANMPAFLRDKNGYRVGEINSRPVKAHRAAWAYVTGYWPKSSVDHKDRDRSNNAFCNLRLASHRENTWNSVVCRNKAGLRGAYFDKRRGVWFTSVRTKDGKNKYFGPFTSAKEAHNKYNEVCLEMRHRLHPRFLAKA